MIADEIMINTNYVLSKRPSGRTRVEINLPTQQRTNRMKRTLILSQHCIDFKIKALIVILVELTYKNVHKLIPNERKPSKESFALLTS